MHNAFAVPGGYIYVTRQLTALMDNEAELAGVLRHEVGHVAACHVAKRQKAATRNSILGALGLVVSGVLLGGSSFGLLSQNVFSQGSQLLTLKFSRAQELEADNLGIAYLERAGYDPRAMASVLDSLGRQTALDARLCGNNAAVAVRASTHPDPASRVREALARAGSTSGATNRDAFLQGINGLVYDDDPKQSIVEGRSFTRPDLRPAFEAPAGFTIVNRAGSIWVTGQSGKAEFAGGPYSGNLDAYISNAFAPLTGAGQTRISPDALESASVNGITARYGLAQLQCSSEPLDVPCSRMILAAERRITSPASRRPAPSNLADLV